MEKFNTMLEAAEFAATLYYDMSAAEVSEFRAVKE